MAGVQVVAPSVPLWEEGCSFAGKYFPARSSLVSFVHGEKNVELAKGTSSPLSVPYPQKVNSINGPPERPRVQKAVAPPVLPTPRYFCQAPGDSFSATVGDITGGGSVWELDDWEDEDDRKLERVGDLSPNGAFGRCLVLRIDVSQLAQVGVA